MPASFRVHAGSVVLDFHPDHVVVFKCPERELGGAGGVVGGHGFRAIGKNGGGPQKLDKVLSYMSDSPDGGIDNGKNQKEAQSTV